MKLIDNILWIEFSDFIEAGWKEDSIKKANYRNGSRWVMMDNPEDKRRPLVRFDTLVDENKAKIEQRFGNPYDLVARQPITNMVQQDAKAELFFSQYRYADDKMLPIKTVRKYTRAASWLNMLADVQKNRAIIKKTLHLTIPEFYLHCGGVIKAEKVNGKLEQYAGLHQLPGDFPATYQRLMTRVSEYKEKGYSYLIDPMYGNKVAAKIGKTEEGYCVETATQQEALIRKLAGLHNNLDNTQIADMVNVVFTKNNWPAVSPQTVANVIKKYQALVTPGRRGARVYDNEVAMQVKRIAPSSPLYYWTMDGWTAELLYQENGKYDNRLVMVVVLDACGKYPVGYAIGDRENTELIRQALRNSIIHMKELFGDCYRPWQLQSDRYGLKTNTPFYAAVAHMHTPAAVGNAKAKIIEPYFKYINKQYCQKQFNWSGFNITASKKNQVNTEYLNKIKHSFPTKQEVIMQLERIMATERASKYDAFVQGWQQLATDDKVLLSAEDMLMVFGLEHKFLNTVTGEGLIATIEGEKKVYDSFEPAFRQLQFTTQFKLVYEPEDTSRVLALTEDGKQRFLLQEKMAVAMDIKSTTPEMLDYRKRINDFNKSNKDRIIQTYIDDAQLVDQLVDATDFNLSDPNELSLKLMLTYNGQQKEKLQDAKGLKQVQRQLLKAEERATKEENISWQQQQQQFLNSQTDFNKYLD